MKTYQPKTIKRVQVESQKARRGNTALMLKAIILSSLLLISTFLSWAHLYEEKQMPVIETVKAIVAFEPQNPAGPNAVIISAFGWRTSPISMKSIMHKGIDFPLASGSSVWAAESGVVIKTETHRGGYGKQILISHQDSFQTRYAHLSSFLVEIGDSVKKGELIARSGNTGLSTKPHLHFELHKNGKAIDPIPWIDRK